MVSFLKRIFRRKTAAPDAPPKPKRDISPIKVKITKVEKGGPLFAIKRKESQQRIVLPEHHRSDAEALSEVVNTTPEPPRTPAAPPEKPVSVEQVAAALKRRPRKRKEAVMQRPKERRKPVRKTRHDKLVEKIARR